MSRKARESVFPTSQQDHFQVYALENSHAGGKETDTRMFIATLLIRTRNWKQSVNRKMDRSNMVKSRNETTTAIKLTELAIWVNWQHG